MSRENPMPVSVRRALLGLATLSLVVTDAAAPQASGVAPPAEVVDSVIRFTAADGTPLEAKLSFPAGAKDPVPVVFLLHGAGPRNYDHALRYRESNGQIRTYRYYDFHASELAKRGLAFFRMSKRGVTADSLGRPQVDRAAFSKATPSILLDDYARAIDVLRGRKEVDASRIVLAGSSEGTRLAPQLALRSPSGIAGLVLMSYQSVNHRETVVWQNTVGPWRNIQKLVPSAADGRLTRVEYDAAVAREATLARRLPFAPLDTNGDSTITQEELAGLNRQRLDAILAAVEQRNDDLIWQAVLNLSSAYLLEDWSGEPTSTMLLKLSVPLAIFHGELDGSTSVEGVRETESAFRATGKTNLTVRVYPEHDHDLNWTIESARAGGTVPFQDAFAFAAGLVRPR